MSNEWGTQARVKNLKRNLTIQQATIIQLEAKIKKLEEQRFCAVHDTGYEGCNCPDIK